MRFLIAIPAFNEAESLEHVLSDIKVSMGGLKADILVVDDGSTDKTSAVALKQGAIVIAHVINRGLGAALTTGFRYSLLKGYDYVVTCDADGQHSGEDIVNVAKSLLSSQAEIVIGSRLLIKNRMPFIRQFVNWMSNVITYVLFGFWTTDSQSGLRAFTKKALIQMNLRSQRMEVSSEIFKEISRLKLNVYEIPIAAIYTRYSLTKGQRVSNAPHVFWKLIQHRFT